ncbi:heat shock protein Pdr13 [Schizosaccharomyces japonicus yFS275]|uniref:Heat shock protein Pdr13 n=1 Tax=Schizosaccharomyces japonicus (strain yFS275 / FY16936) TaxID=402676 RepID=B6JY51_SCHJY|nr:heat shock protein Pdr13 [Schizosaccharomyces japonicus yFS275]EEB06469.1 heat shock protein Pdr13 [Schizosaccharomyces japonicus yFS275]
MSDLEEYKTVIGLSFGNQNSSISFTKDGKTECLANEEGDRQIPAIFSYQGSEEYHGVQAYGQLVRNSHNTILNFRDMLGKSSEDVTDKKHKRSAKPISVNGQPGFSVTVVDPETGAETTSKKTVYEFTVRHLNRLFESARDFLGKKLDGCVIAVPSDFSEKQIEMLSKASKEAGVPAMQFVKESAAQILALMYSDSALVDKFVVVADFGATRSEVSVASIKSGIITILSNEQDLHLGGEQLTEVLVNFFAKEFEKKHKINPLTNRRAIAKLHAQCEITKRILSNNTTASAAIDSLVDGIDFHSNINRLRFELAGSSIFNKMSDLVVKAVKKAGLETVDINEVILAGGASHSPKLTSLMWSVFPEQTVIRSSASSATPLAVNPAELAAVGAGVQASLIAEFDADEIAGSLTPDVVNAPHLTKPIGINEGDNFVVVFDIETALPAQKSIECVAPAEGGAYIPIYEGERSIKVTTVEADADESDFSEEEEPEEIRERVVTPGTLLATVNIADVAPKAKVEVILHLDAEGKLTVTARPKDGKGSNVRGSN